MLESTAASWLTNVIHWVENVISEKESQYLTEAMGDTAFIWKKP